MFRHGCSVAATLAKPLVTGRQISLDVLATADTIALRGLQFHGFHGALPEETVLGQRFTVTAILYCGHGGLAVAGTSDDLNKSVNYADAYNSIKSVVEGEPRKLIESVAEEIAERILASYPKLQATRVCVGKPNAPIHGNFESVEVEIIRMNTAHAK